MPRVLVVGQTAGRTLEIVELHDHHFRSFRIDRHVDFRLHVPPALELGALGVGQRRKLWRDGRRLRERAAFAREGRNERHGAADEKDRYEEREGTLRERAGITRRAPRQCGHGKFRGSARDDEDGDDGNVSRHAQQAHGFQLEERRPCQIQHERQRDRRQRENVTGDVLALGIGAPAAQADEEEHQREIQNAAERHRHAPKTTIATQIRLRAADRRADVAGARIGRVGHETVVDVSGSRRRYQSEQREGHQQRSCP